MKKIAALQDLLNILNNYNSLYFFPHLEESAESVFLNIFSFKLNIRIQFPFKNMEKITKKYMNICSLLDQIFFMSF